MSCAEEEEITSTPGLSSLGNTWPVSTDAIFTDQDTTTTEVTTEDNATTEHEDDINQSPTITSTSIAHDVNLVTEHKLPITLLNANKFNRLNIDKTLDLGLVHNNNLQSNYIPKMATGDNYVTNEQLEKIEDEKHMQHKMLHEEIARLGNLENIFTQPTDHFVPPLVMAKAKISDDMTVLSLREKHAQQMAEEHYYKQGYQYGQNDHVYHSNTIKSTTEDPKPVPLEKDLVMHIVKNKDGSKKDKLKSTMPKKYNEKIDDPKNKALKAVETKQEPLGKTEQSITQSTIAVRQSETTPMTHLGKMNEESALDLTVFLKDEPEIRDEKMFYTNYSGDVSKLEVVSNGTLNNETEIKLVDVEATEEIKHENPVRTFDESTKNITLNHEVIKITIISEGHTTGTPTTFEITTKAPVLQDTTPVASQPTSTHEELGGDFHNISDIVSTAQSNTDTTTNHVETEPVVNISSVADVSTIANDTNANDTVVALQVQTTTTTTEGTPTTMKVAHIETTQVINNSTNHDDDIREASSTPAPEAVDPTHDMKFEHFGDETHDEFDSNSTDSIDDFQSPLLSGANEPVHRPNRSRRPQQPNRNRFNPLRILG